HLFEAGAVLEGNEGGGTRTVLDLARAAGVGVLANRPLNASVDDGLLRLASVRVAGPAADLEAQLAALEALELEYRPSIAAHLQPAERRGESLSRKALWVVASTPGISSVLVGMRDPEYVRDATAVLSWPPLADPAAVYRAFAGLSLS